MFDYKKIINFSNDNDLNIGYYVYKIQKTNKCRLNIPNPMGEDLNMSFEEIIEYSIKLCRIVAIIKNETTIMGSPPKQFVQNKNKVDYFYIIEDHTYTTDDRTETYKVEQDDVFFRKSDDAFDYIKFLYDSYDTDQCNYNSWV